MSVTGEHGWPMVHVATLLHSCSNMERCWRASLHAVVISGAFCASDWELMDRKKSSTKKHRAENQLGEEARHE